jgi:hypothetical protein
MTQTGQFRHAGGNGVTEASAEGRFPTPGGRRSLDVRS